MRQKRLRTSLLVISSSAIVAACGGQSDLGPDGRSTDPACALTTGSNACEWLAERLERCAQMASGVYGTVWLSSIASTPGTGSRCVSTALDGPRGKGSARVLVERAGSGESAGSADVVEGAFSLRLPPGSYVLRFDFEERASLPIVIGANERKHVEVVVGGFGNFATEVQHPRLDPERDACTVLDGNATAEYPGGDGCKRHVPTLASCLTFPTGVYGVAELSYQNQSLMCVDNHRLYARDGFARIAATRESDGRRWDGSIVDGIFAFPLPPGRYRVRFDTRFTTFGAPPEVILDLNEGQRAPFRALIFGAYGNVYASLKQEAL